MAPNLSDPCPRLSTTGQLFIWCDGGNICCKIWVSAVRGQPDPRFVSPPSPVLCVPCGGRLKFQRTLHASTSCPRLSAMYNCADTGHGQPQPLFTGTLNIFFALCLSFRRKRNLFSFLKIWFSKFDVGLNVDLFNKIAMDILIPSNSYEWDLSSWSWTLGLVSFIMLCILTVNANCGSFVGNRLA